MAFSRDSKRQASSASATGRLRTIETSPSAYSFASAGAARKVTADLVDTAASEATRELQHRFRVIEAVVIGQQRHGDGEPQQRVGIEFNV